MLLNEFLNDSDYARMKERRHRTEEEERANAGIANDFDNDNTSMDEFDIDIVKKVIAMAVKKSPKLQRQADEMLRTWEEELHSGAYLNNDEFNKLFKQFEQLKDSNDTPLIQFNKLHTLTKELSDATDEFDNWKDSDDASELKWKNKKNSDQNEMGNLDR